MPSEIVERFTAEHFTLNSISEQRQQQVRMALRRLEEFLSLPIETASDNELRAWLAALLQQGLMPSTVAWHLKMVKPFYRWCWRQRVIDADNYMRIREVRSPRGSLNGKPRPYSRKELAQLWAELEAAYPYAKPHILRRWDRGTSPFRSVKKHAMRLQFNAIIDLALVCGLRRSEIYQLAIDDVHWDNKYIVVHGKRVDQNERVREVPYPESTRTAVREWFRMRGLMSPEPGLPLWLSVTGPEPAAAMTPKRWAVLMHKLGSGWELHRLRHTCATERLRAGMELVHLKEFLGHANIEQTLAYAELVRSDVHKASERIDAEFQRAIRPPDPPDAE